MRGIISILLLICFYSVQAQVQSAGGFAVLELFTSEGCSSCPPADDAFIDIAKTYPGNVYQLEFHVDYWNSLGWKDPFSNAEYSVRQNRYGKQFQLNSIYTPQVVVNGKTEFTGSDKNRLNSSINASLKGKAATQNISLTMKAGDGNKITVGYTVNASTENTVNIALVQLLATSRVMRGENEGKILQHTHIVRDFKTIDDGKGNGNLVLTIPDGLKGKDCRLIGFLQRKKSGEIVGATEMAIP